jgi:hypothetical protein
VRRFLPLVMALAVVLAALVPLAGGTAAAAGGLVYVESGGAVNVRSAPSLSAPVMTQVYGGDAVVVTGTVAGQSVGGDSTWYRTKSGWFISDSVVSGSPTSSGAGTSGRWIDVNLSTLRASAMVGNTAVYTAPIVSGKPGWETPTGHFSILRRPGTVTMSSATFGLQPGDPNYYVQPNVPYTQYFDNSGDALHGNYWSPDSAFGNYNTSHGCVGMRNGDAAYFWNFGAVGMPVYIHY